MTDTTRTNTDNSDLVQLISKEDVEQQFGEAAASTVSTDRVVTWAKFILTDDKPNGNRQRVPVEEFNNIIRTGVFKPVKMAIGEIKDGHEDAKPLGVITNLKIEGNKIVALAALWDHERDEDVAQIKNLVRNNKPVNVSWEILYGDSKIKDGVSDLLDVVLKAVTIVGMPAYAGRTQLIAVAASKWSKAYIQSLPNTSFLHIEKDGTRYFAYRDETGKIDQYRLPVILEEIPKTPLSQNIQKNIRHQVNKMKSVIEADAGLQELLNDGEDSNTEEQEVEIKDYEDKVRLLETQVALANDKLATKETELATAQEQANIANIEVKKLEEEISPLREFKLEADKEAEKEQKLSAIKAKFESVKLEKPEEYFIENAEKLLSLDENGLDFMLQEMVAFKENEGNGDGEASLKPKKSNIPNVSGEHSGMSITDMAVALRERNSKK